MPFNIYAVCPLNSKEAHAFLEMFHLSTVSAFVKALLIAHLSVCFPAWLKKGKMICFIYLFIFIKLIHHENFCELVWNQKDQSSWSITSCLRQIIKFQSVPFVILTKIDWICLFVSIANRSGAAYCSCLSLKNSMIPLWSLLELLESTRMQISVF